jgi:hypothetical protein
VRAPVRTLSAPRRRGGPARPRCLPRVLERPISDAQINRWCDTARRYGILRGREIEEAHLIDRFLDGRDVDLMTKAELHELSLVLIRLVSKVLDKQAAIPVEWYRREPNKVYLEDDDIDI